ncbi:MAG: hypothetical protein QW228_07380 [Candidatus Aenigmatarchaeota archaeon]
MSGCCNYLFDDFVFEDLTSAKPPDKKGVYVIRVKSKREVPLGDMIEKTRQLLSNIGWDLVTDFIMSRVKRLENIGNCPIIYIGSAGTQKESKNTLKKRYEEFANRHTAMYPIWVLLYFGWKLELGWKISANPLHDENELKRNYQILHGGKLPALVEK